jgi:hypothetical protein
MLGSIELRTIFDLDATLLRRVYGVVFIVRNRVVLILVNFFFYVSGGPGNAASFGRGWGRVGFKYRQHA